jgi:hypothetical protein
MKITKTAKDSWIQKVSKYTIRGFFYLLWIIGLYSQFVPILIYVFSKEYRYENLLDSINH